MFSVAVYQSLRYTTSRPMERFSTYLVGIILFAALALILIYDPFSFRGTSQTYLTDESIPVGSQNRWDSSRTTSPVVLYDYDAKIYKMWYVGIGANDAQHRSGIGYATSTDGVQWTPKNDPVLFAQDDWETAGFRSVHVAKDSNRYYMWYSAEDSGGKQRIGYATSGDGTHWSKSANNPVLGYGDNGAWDERTVEQPFVLRTGEMWRMWYTGTNGAGTANIGYATSGDGIHWAKASNNPVFSGQKTWDTSGVSGAFVATQYDGQLYELWFAGVPKGKNKPASIGRAYSNDGVTWAEDDANPLVIADKTSFLDPWSVTINGVSYVWLEEQVSKGIAHKTIHFTQSPKQLTNGEQALPLFVPIFTDPSAY